MDGSNTECVNVHEWPLVDETSHNPLLVVPWIVVDRSLSLNIIYARGICSFERLDEVKNGVHS